MKTDLLEHSPIDHRGEPPGLLKVEAIPGDTEPDATPDAVPGASRTAGPSRAHLQAETWRWDAFWAKHGAGQGFIDRILWPTRRVFSKHHAKVLLSYMLRSRPPSNPSLRVLEIGCGSATTSKFISRGAAEAKIFVVDLSEAAIKVARARNPDLRCVVADATALPFASDKFSLSFSSGVIEHFDRSVAGQLHDEHCRVTRKGGTVGLIVPWKHSPYNLLRILCGARWPFGYENPFSIGELRGFAQTDCIAGVQLTVSYGTTLTAAGRKRDGFTWRPRDSNMAIEPKSQRNRSTASSHSYQEQRARGTVLGESRTFKAALALNLAARRSRLGPSTARIAYWLWDSVWDGYFAVRAALLGHAARFEVLGRSMLMDMRDQTVTRVLYIFGEYEPFETALLSRLLKPGFTFVDIGANTGYYTLIAALGVGEHGKVIAFEPSPLNVATLQGNVRLNNLGNVVVEDNALSSGDDDVMLYFSSINAGDHRIYDGHDDEFYNAGRVRSRIRVRAVTLDRYLTGQSLSADVIKMDVQGAEFDVLKGMIATLSSNENVILMAEYWPHGLERCGGKPMDFLTTLDRLGFRIFRACAEGEAEEVGLQDVADSVTGLESSTLFFSRFGLCCP